jgi:hypothetical protein
MNLAELGSQSLVPPQMLNGRARIFSTSEWGWNHLQPLRGGAFMNYPTTAEVIAADHDQISLWWHFLQDPETPEQERAMDLIFKKYYVNGGFIEPELRKPAMASK